MIQQVFPALIGLFGGLWLGVHGAPAAHAAAAQAEGPVFLQTEASTYRRAAFAHFLAYLPNSDQPGLAVDGAISISNVCAAPEELDLFIGDAPSRGRIKLVLYNLDGTRIQYVSGPDAPGEGLDAAGELPAGQTWTVRLAEVLASGLGVPETQVGDFRGYAWVLAEFDCLAGTYTNTIFGLGFSQAYELSPAMGQGGFFGGVQLPNQ